MPTTADRLALLQRTKAGQKALLEKMYPNLDFSTIPFREYGRLFTGRAYVPGFVGGWKSYGRSNTEDASTRDTIPDYSGNGRDIKLYNFGFSGKSGWGGYALSFVSDFFSEHTDRATYTKTATNINITEVTSSANFTETNDKERTQPAFKFKVTGLPAGATLRYWTSVAVTSDGIYDAPSITGIYIGFKVQNFTGTCNINIEMLPLYPGGLLSDGVDDYGQCIKGFSLPDDYTVVAIRNIISSTDAALASKTKAYNNGAFIFEYSGDRTYSYSSLNRITFPTLFSWQSKTQYNGTQITVGDALDTEEDMLSLFILRPNELRGFCKAVLYDLRIYDHSLTDMELKAVKNEMMSDFIEGTGILDGLNYVADWDAAGKSNEDADRDKWVDKVNGKVISLNNYAFAEMSGWNGYALDLLSSGWYSDYTNYYALEKISSSKIRFTSSDDNSRIDVNYYRLKTVNGGNVTLRMVGFLNGDKVRFAYREEENGQWKNISPGSQVNEYMTVEIPIKNYGFLMQFTLSEATHRDITIEQLPIYAGLCSDGIDDYGQSTEAIAEEIGTMLMLASVDMQSNGTYNLDIKNDTTGRLYLYRNNNGQMQAGTPAKIFDDGSMFTYSRTPISPNAILNIGCNATQGLFGKFALARLILLKDQLSDAQIEALKWRVQKEYDDYLKEMGWNNQ